MTRRKRASGVSFYTVVAVTLLILTILTSAIESNGVRATTVEPDDTTGDRGGIGVALKSPSPNHAQTSDALTAAHFHSVVSRIVPCVFRLDGPAEAYGQSIAQVAQALPGYDVAVNDVADDVADVGSLQRKRPDDAVSAKAQGGRHVPKAPHVLAPSQPVSGMESTSPIRWSGLLSGAEAGLLSQMSAMPTVGPIGGGLGMGSGTNLTTGSAASALNPKVPGASVRKAALPVKSPPPCDTPVTFVDPHLEAAVRECIGKSSGTICAEDLAGVHSLNARNRGITDLGGLEWCTDLVSLDLYDNAISDLSPVSGLANLMTLNLGMNQITGISALAGLTNLVGLELGSSDLNQMEFLLPNTNHIADISPLSNLTRLVYLGLADVGTGHIEAIDSMPNLAILWLQGNPIADFSPLAGHDELKLLALMDTGITDEDMEALHGLPRLVGLGLSMFGSSDLSDLSALEACPHLALLVLRNDDSLSDVSVCSSLPRLKEVFFRNCGIADLSAFSGLTHLRAIEVEDNLVTDLGALAYSDLAEVWVNAWGNTMSLESLCTYIPEFVAIGNGIAHDGACGPTHTLLIERTGEGEVNPPLGNRTIEAYATVNLEAWTPAPQWTFDHWEGDLSTTSNTATLVMDADKAVRAVFRTADWKLRLPARGAGSTSPGSGPRGYRNGARVDVSASPEPGWTFSHWEGDLATTSNTATITMDADKSATAVFSPQPVDFPDAHLEQAVRTALSKPTGAITTDDLANLITLDAPDFGIADLTGLEWCTNLRYANLYGNAISDLSPLSGLEFLTSLDLGMNQISDVDAIAALTDLTALELGTGNLLESLALPDGTNHITDISPLARLGKLVYLGLAGNGLTRLDTLANFPALQFLWLQDNSPIADFTPLSGLAGLQCLSLANTGLDDDGMAVLGELPNLVAVLLANNSISDLSALSGSPGLAVLLADNNPLSDISALGALAGLNMVTLNGCQIEDLSPLGSLTALTSLELQFNQVSDLEPLTGESITGAHIAAWGNPLSSESLCTHIPTIQSHDNVIAYDGACSGDVRSLTIQISGTGAVRPPAGSRIVPKNSTVDLAAVGTNPDWGFDHWEGAIQGTSEWMPILMDADKSVSAFFLPADWLLNIFIDGNGSTWPTGKRHGYRDGHTANLLAYPDPGWRFDHWSGDATGPDPYATVLMDSRKEVTAVFLPSNPPTVDLSASPLEIALGESSTLSWTSTFADACAISPGVGAVAPNGSMPVFPTAITRYVITATGPGGVAEDDVSVVVHQPPAVSISADPATILSGQSSTLSWTSTYADSCTITPGIGLVAPNGTTSVSPTQTTTYQITATGPGGQAVSSATITVNHAPTVSITASPETILPTESSTLSWTSTYADTCSIDHGIGPVAPVGSLEVYPTTDTTYTVTAVGPGGEATDSVTVHMGPSITFSVSPTSIIAGEAATLSWTTTGAVSCSLTPGFGAVPTAGERRVTPRTTTTYTLSASSAGGATATRDVTLGVNLLPTVTIAASPAIVTPGQSNQLTWSSAGADLCSIDQGIGTVGNSDTLTVFPMTTTTYTITAANSYGSVTAKTVIRRAQTPGTFAASYQDLIPQDALHADYDPKRFSVITGVVHDVTGAPLAGVAVNVLAHADYGTAHTGIDGRFSMPVEGGYVTTVVFRKDGYVAIQRPVYVAWNDTAIVETPVMIARDSTVSELVFAPGHPEAVLTHTSSEIVDARGTRCATLVFSADTEVDAIDVAGNTQPLCAMRVSATEFTTPESMPAKLPPTSAFTYCIDLHAQGLDFTDYAHVQFSKPVFVWVKDFLGFAPGTIVPVGWYDEDKGIWRPAENGVVARLMDSNGDGAVDAADTTGDDVADDFDIKGLDNPQKYHPGDVYWRVAIDHFSAWDFNWPVVMPDDADYPNPDSPAVKDRDDDCVTCTNSYVADKSRAFHEDIPVAGTDLTLHYSSERTSGFHQVITVPASGDAPPESANRIDVRLEVAGRTFFSQLPAAEHQVAQFDWDGLDALGRPVTINTLAKASVGFVYDAEYGVPMSNAIAFGQTGGASTGVKAATEMILWKYSDIILPGHRNKGTLAEGWTLSAHHQLDMNAFTTVFKGDGSVFPKSEDSSHKVYTVAGNRDLGEGGDGGPATEAGMAAATNMAVDAAGNIYIAEWFTRKVDTNGIMSTISTATGPLAVDAQGNVYIADYFINKIFKVSPTGVESHVAGTGSIAHFGDNGPALDASFVYMQGLCFDPSGNLYVADSDDPWNFAYGSRVRKIDTNGIITTVAGGGNTELYAPSVGVVPALDLRLQVLKDVVVDRLGTLYIAQPYSVISVDTTGQAMIVAGLGSDEGSVPADGNLAVDSTVGPYGLGVDAAGYLYIADDWDAQILRVDSSGLLTVMAGVSRWNSDPPDCSDGISPRDTHIDLPRAVSVDAAGSVYYVDISYGGSVVQKISRDWFVKDASTVQGDSYLIPDETGVGYVMTHAGRHEKTIDLETRATLLHFSYGENNRLTGVADRFGNTVTIAWNGDTPTQIASPDGLVTVLQVQNNRLSRVTYPDSGHYDFVYSDDGLMLEEIDPNGNAFTHEFDQYGKVLAVHDPEGGNWQSSNAAEGSGAIASQLVSGEGDTTTYEDKSSFCGDLYSKITSASGAITEFWQKKNGLQVEKALPCGTEVAAEYAFLPDEPLLLQPERQHKYLVSLTEWTPSYVTKFTRFDHERIDTNADALADVLVERMTVNDRTSTVQNDTLAGIVSMTSPEERTVTVEYNTGTLLTTAVHPPGGLFDTAYEYDNRGRVTGTSQNDRHVSFTYNDQGEIETTTDPLQRTTRYQYDAVGRVTRIERPDNHSVAFTYDANGNMTVLTTPSVVDHGFAYNGIDLKTAYDTPQNGAYTYSYDRDRRLTATAFPSGKRIENTYANGNLVRVDAKDAQGAVVDTVSFAYETCGNKLAVVANGVESTSYDYDGPLTILASNTGVLNADFAYAYDNDFRVAEFVWRDDADVVQADRTCVYDDDGLLVGSGSFVITRNADNALPIGVSDIADGGAYELGRTFDGFGETKAQTATIDSTPLFLFALDRNAVGQITSNTQTLASDTNVYGYQYDSLGRLATVTENGSNVESYTYDANGNRLTETNARRGIANRTFAYDDEDHLVSASIGSDVTTYAYDVDGFLATKTHGTDVTGYEYTSRGELVRVTLPDGRTVEYQYDPFGQRIAKRINGVVTEKYLWHGGALLAVYNSGNQLVMRFEGAKVTAASGVYYLMSDHVGTLRAIADTAGNIVKQIDYDAFGNVLYDTNPSFRVPYGFANGLYDPDTGLVRFGARDYDPDTGRWTAKDPILFAGGDTNLYGYCVSDPIDLVDRSGLIFDVLFDIASVGYDLYSLVTDPSWANAGFLGVDLVAAVIPIAPAPGATTHLAAGAGRSVKASRMVKACEAGKAGEAAVAKATGLTKNTSIVRVREGQGRIPDFVSEDAVIEVKNVAKQSFTRQLRDLNQFAQDEGKILELWLPESATVSKPLQAAIDARQITRRNIPK